jgi:tetratricopeptide (TPR) repeat protein
MKKYFGKFTSSLLLLLLTGIVFICIQCSSPETEKSTNNQLTPQDSSKTKFELINKKIIDNPNSGDLFLERAALHKENNEIIKGIEDIQRAISLDSLNPKYHLIFGEYCYLASDIGSAKKAMEKSVSLDKGNPDALIKLAEVHLILRDYKSALSKINEALQINERLENGYYMKGFVFKEMGNTKAALSSFQTAIEVNPNYYDAYIMLGLINASNKNSIAEEYYKTAIALKPKSAEALYNLGMYYQENNKPDKAIETYSQLKIVDPKNALADYNMGYVYLEILKDNKFAIENFSAAIKKLPTYAESHYNRGLAYERLGNFNDALSDYKKALELKSNYQLAIEGINRMVK